jgi:hypothetical protein
MYFGLQDKIKMKLNEMKRTHRATKNAEFLSLQRHKFITKDPIAVPRWHSPVCQATHYDQNTCLQQRSYILYETEGQGLQKVTLNVSYTSVERALH